MSKKALLVICDGWGIGNHSKADVIYNTPTPYWDSLVKDYPVSQLLASGENVGLPDGQMGNSEVGHLNIGAGRVVYQDLVKINIACRENKIQQNPEIVKAYSYAKENNKNIIKENIRPREIKIISKTAKILKDYIKDKKDYEYMFKSRKGSNDHITVSHVSRVLNEAGQYFGLQNITAHSMRKTYAYLIYVESGYDIVAVKEMLGHSSIEITKRYLGLDRELYDKYSDKLNSLIR